MDKELTTVGVGREAYAVVLRKRAVRAWGRLLAGVDRHYLGDNGVDASADKSADEAKAAYESEQLMTYITRVIRTEYDDAFVDDVLTAAGEYASSCLTTEDVLAVGAEGQDSATRPAEPCQAFQKRKKYKKNKRQRALVREQSSPPVPVAERVWFPGLSEGSTIQTFSFQEAVSLNVAAEPVFDTGFTVVK